MSTTGGSERADEVTPAWLQQIVYAVEGAEEISPSLPAIKDLLGEGAPLWVENAGRELVKALLPVAKLKPGKVWKPAELAAIIGHKCAYLAWLTEFGETLSNKIAELAPEDALRKEFEERITKFGKGWIEFLVAVNNASKFALTIAFDQEYAPACQFFSAFSKALALKPRYGHGLGRTTTLLYFVMIVNWRGISEFRTVRELHEFLCQHRLLGGNHQVGDLKRIEKICERINLSYRKKTQAFSAPTQSDMTA